jgi:hypothetical protein
MLPADFSGYWRVAKLENFDIFLQDLGLPWVVRKVSSFTGSCIVPNQQRACPWLEGQRLFNKAAGLAIPPGGG